MRQVNVPVSRSLQMPLESAVSAVLAGTPRLPGGYRQRRHRQWGSRHPFMPSQCGADIPVRACLRGQAGMPARPTLPAVPWRFKPFL